MFACIKRKVRNSFREIFIEIQWDIEMAQKFGVIREKVRKHCTASLTAISCPETMKDVQPDQNELYDTQRVQIFIRPSSLMKVYSLQKDAIMPIIMCLHLSKKERKCGRGTTSLRLKSTPPDCDSVSSSVQSGKDVSFLD